MKTYTITVNGVSYDVTVEEGVKGTGAVQMETPVRQAVNTIPVQQEVKSVVKETPVVEQKTISNVTGNIKVEAGAAGKVFKVVATVGQKIKENETVVILEAMKMEIPVVAPKSGTIMSVEVAVGDAVEAGAILVTINE